VVDWFAAAAGCRFDLEAPPQAAATSAKATRAARIAPRRL
jgi:hypothetical protein